MKEEQERRIKAEKARCASVAFCCTVFMKTHPCQYLACSPLAQCSNMFICPCPGKRSLWRCSVCRRTLSAQMQLAMRCCMCRQESERQRQMDIEKRKFERLIAAAGGAGFGIFVSIAGETFRIIGGPTIIAQTLRTPGARRTTQRAAWAGEQRKRQAQHLHSEQSRSWLSLPHGAWTRGLRQAGVGKCNERTLVQVSSWARLSVSWSGTLRWRPRSPTATWSPCKSALARSRGKAFARPSPRRTTSRALKSSSSLRTCSSCTSECSTNASTRASRSPSCMMATSSCGQRCAAAAARCSLFTERLQPLLAHSLASCCTYANKGHVLRCTCDDSW